MFRSRNFVIISLLLSSLSVCFGYNVHEDDDQHSKILSDVYSRIFTKECAGPYLEMPKNSSFVFRSLQQELPNPLIFAIYTTDIVSILLQDHNNTKFNYYNITLGIDKNRLAQISKATNDKNETTSVLKLPTTPYLIKIQRNDQDINVSDIQTDMTFLSMPVLGNLGFNITQVSFERVYKKPMRIFTDCCDRWCSKRIFHRISGCRKYVTSKATYGQQEKFDLANYIMPQRGDGNYLFNGLFIIDYPQRSKLAAKIRFTTSEDKLNGYLIELTDTQAFIYFKAQSNSTFRRCGRASITVRSPMSINITMTKGTSAEICLTESHLDQPLLCCRPSHCCNTTLKKDPLYISMGKSTDDYSEYHFYHECRDVQTYSDKKLGVKLESKIFPAKYKRRGHDRFDYLNIFEETFDLFKRHEERVIQETDDFEDSSKTTDDEINENNKKKSDKETTSNLNSDAAVKKVIAYVSSALFVGVLKMLCSADCIKDKFVSKEQEDQVVDKYRRSVSSLTNKAFKEIDDDD